MRNNILIDIDHTLSDAAWRDNLIGGPGGWDEYHTQSNHDTPCDDIASLIGLLRSSENVGLNIIGITARPEKWRVLTNTWLTRHDIGLDELLMRPDAAFHPAPEIKLQLARTRFGDKFAERILCIIDDRDDVCAAFRAAGVTALQVYGRKYDV